MAAYFARSQAVALRRGRHDRPSSSFIAGVDHSGLRRDRGRGAGSSAGSRSSAWYDLFHAELLVLGRASGSAGHAVRVPDRAGSGRGHQGLIDHKGDGAWINGGWMA